VCRKRFLLRDATATVPYFRPIDRVRSTPGLFSRYVMTGHIRLRSVRTRQAAFDDQTIRGWKPISDCICSSICKAAAMGYGEGSQKKQNSSYAASIAASLAYLALRQKGCRSAFVTFRYRDFATASRHAAPTSASPDAAKSSPRPRPTGKTRTGRRSPARRLRRSEGWVSVCDLPTCSASNHSPRDCEMLLSKAMTWL